MIAESKDFEPACRTAFDDLRAALIELYASVGADPLSPQDAARRFKVNKTLTWNITRVITATEPIASLPNVPGAGPLRSLLQAMHREGAQGSAIERVRRAASALEHLVELHVGDRATLELVVDGLYRHNGDRLDLSRKLAFRGNSGLWGVQAKTRLMTAFMAPNAQDPDRIDMAIVRGYIGLRRLRTDVRWPIFQIRGWGSESDPMTAARWQPLDESIDADKAMPLLPGFSTIGSSGVEEVRTSRGLDYVLAPGPIGNAGAVDCFIGDCAHAAASKYSTEQDTTGEFGATISAPTERLVFDLLVHESLSFALDAEVRAFGGIFMERSEEAVPEGQLPITVPQSLMRLPGRPPVVADPYVPRYSELVAFVYQRMQWHALDFRACRFELTYPPMGSTILLRFKLPVKP